MPSSDLGLSRRCFLGSAGAAGLTAGKVKPLRRAISAANPLFVLEGGTSMWNLLPEAFRPYCAMMITAGSGNSADGSRLSLFRELKKLRAAGIPVFISVQGDEADVIPTRIDTIIEALKEFPNLIGCRAAELSCGPGFTAPEWRNIIDLINVCGEHRALLNWQDMGFPYQRDHIFTEAGRDRELFDALSRNGESVILSEKNNGWGKYYQTRSLVLGMWTSGIVANWGFNAEDWWWFEQGYGERFLPSKGRRGYARKHGAGVEVTGGWEFASALSCPDIFYGQNVMCAIAGGATVFSFESGHAYGHQDQNGVFQLSPAWKNVIYPLLKDVLDYKLIPTREQVVARMKVAYQDSGEVGTELDASGEALYRPLYGALKPEDKIIADKLSSELLMRTGRYYYLPVLPKLAPQQARARFANIIGPRQFASAEAQRAYFDKLYPAESSGGALVLHINNTWFVTNPHENQDIAEDFRFSLQAGSSPVEMAGRLEPHSLIFVREGKRKLYIEANNYLVKTHIWDEPRPARFDIEAYLRKYVSSPDDKEMRTATLQLAVPGKGRPSLTHTTRHGSVASTWHAESRKMEIRLDHNGPMSLVLSL